MNLAALPLVAVVIASTGCGDPQSRKSIITIACLGDSNTCNGMPGKCDVVTSWCAHWEMDPPRLRTSEEEVVELRFLNFAVGGATVCDSQAFANSEVPFDAPSALVQYESARHQDVPAEIVILAFGTNDIDLMRLPPATVIDCYRAIWERAESDGVKAYLALIPPAFEWTETGSQAEFNAKIIETNRLLRREFPSDRWIDFHTEFSNRKYFVALDPVHFNEAGQRLRAQRVREVVR